MSRPIDIVSDSKSTIEHEEELVYCNDDLDFSSLHHHRQQPRSKCSSCLSFSTRGSDSVRMSDSSSDFASTSISPPSVVNPPRPKFNRLSCWANVQVRMQVPLRVFLYFWINLVLFCVFLFGARFSFSFTFFLFSFT